MSQLFLRPVIDLSFFSRNYILLNPVRQAVDWIFRAHYNTTSSLVRKVVLQCSISEWWWASPKINIWYVTKWENTIRPACLQNSILFTKLDFCSQHAPRVGKSHDLVTILSNFGMESIPQVLREYKTSVLMLNSHVKIRDHKWEVLGQDPSGNPPNILRGSEYF